MNKIMILRSEGSDLTVIAAGTMVYESLKAAEILAEQGIAATVIDMHTIKPLDVGAVKKACQDSKLIVTVEEHNIVGGLGSAVAEYKATLRNAPPQLSIGLPDKFGKAAAYKDILEGCGLTTEQIAEKIKIKLEQGIYEDVIQ